MECTLLSSSHEGTDLQIHSLGKIDGLSMGKSGQTGWRYGNDISLIAGVSG